MDGALTRSIRNNYTFAVDINGIATWCARLSNTCALEVDLPARQNIRLQPYAI